MKIKGVSVIELMIAMTISSLLSALLLDHYMHAFGSLALQSSIYQVQEIMNMSADLLTREIQQAGYIGCAKLVPGFPLRASNEFMLNYVNQLVVTDTDLISRHASSAAAQLIELNSVRQVLYVSDNLLFKANDVLIISDCKHAEIFTAKKIYHSHQKIKIETELPLHSDFSTDAEIAYFEINHFYLEKTRKKDLMGESISALFVENIKHSRKQIAVGIKEIHFSSYVNANKKIAVGFQQSININSLQRHWNGYVLTNQ